ncbi:hypothetical protein D3C83_150690 [compost metagenome]
MPADLTTCASPRWLVPPRVAMPIASDSGFAASRSIRSRMLLIGESAATVMAVRSTSSSAIGDKSL